MGRQSFDNYSSLTKSDITFTEMSGRYLFQKDDEDHVVNDVLKKLELSSSDDLLEIGCGPGNLLGPLSEFVNSATGIDNARVIDVLNNRYADSQIKSYKGNFFDLSLSTKYEKILIYSVLHYLSDQDEVYRFIEKSLDLVKPGGKLLLGDLPNINAKERLVNTKFGKTFRDKWNKKLEKSGATDFFSKLDPDDKLVVFTDELIVNILSDFRKKGFLTFLYPQNSNLPFGLSREDILIEKVPE